MKNAIAWVAVCLAVVAAVMSAVALQADPWIRSQRVVPRAPGEPPSEEIGPLASRVGVLEEELSRLRARLEADAMTPAPAPARVAAGESDDPRAKEAAERLARLELAVDGLRAAASAHGGTPPTPPARPRDGALGAADAKRMAEMVRDPAATEEQKLAVLGSLRGRRLEDGTDARLSILDDMIQLARTSTQGEARADVWRQLSHVTDARLKQPLLDALAFDAHPKAREEAAETLADFLPDARVEAALRAAAQDDADARVRRQAVESLAGGR
jgi:hypothetical protein